MPSRELADWLRANEAGTPTGRDVLHVLGKPPGDLTRDDLQVMRKVVAQVHAERRSDLEPVAGQAAWHHRLMAVGHDPLKPVRV